MAHMGFFEDMFDPRRSDQGQMVALRQHDANLTSLERDLDEIAASVRQSDEKLQERFAKLKKHFLALRDRVNRVELVTEALFAHFEAKGEIDRDRLRVLMACIDQADGKADGRARNKRT